MMKKIVSKKYYISLLCVCWSCGDILESMMRKCRKMPSKLEGKLSLALKRIVHGGYEKKE